MGGGERGEEKSPNPETGITVIIKRRIYCLLVRQEDQGKMDKSIVLLIKAKSLSIISEYLCLLCCCFVRCNYVGGVVV